jgi:hypothetical protein
MAEKNPVIYHDVGFRYFLKLRCGFLSISRVFQMLGRYFDNAHHALKKIAKPQILACNKISFSDSNAESVVDGSVSSLCQLQDADDDQAPEIRPRSSVLIEPRLSSLKRSLLWLGLRSETIGGPKFDSEEEATRTGIQYHSGQADSTPSPSPSEYAGQAVLPGLCSCDNTEKHEIASIKRLGRQCGSCPYAYHLRDELDVVRRVSIETFHLDLCGRYVDEFAAAVTLHCGTRCLHR